MYVLLQKLIIEDNDGEPCEDLAPLGRSIPPVNEQGPTVLPYSDESARRLYHLKNGKLLDVAAAESHMRKLSFNNRVLHLPQLGEQLAKQIDSQIHALQHLASENISQQVCLPHICTYTYTYATVVLFLTVSSLFIKIVL